MPLAAIANLSKQVALIDIAPGARVHLPGKWMYGTKRVALFFDFHVEIVPIDYDWSLYQL
jgi:hypothetical protein